MIQEELEKLIEKYKLELKISKDSLIDSDGEDRYFEAASDCDEQFFE